MSKNESQCYSKEIDLIMIVMSSGKCYPVRLRSLYPGPVEHYAFQSLRGDTSEDSTAAMRSSFCMFLSVSSHRDMVEGVSARP